MVSLDKLDQFLKEINKVQIKFEVINKTTIIKSVRTIQEYQVILRYNDCYLLKKERPEIFFRYNRVENYITESKERLENLKIAIRTELFQFKVEDLPRILHTYIELTKDIESNIINKEKYVIDYFHTKKNEEQLSRIDIPPKKIEDSIIILHNFHKHLIMALLRYLNYLMKEIEENPSLQDGERSSIEKIKWMGKPAQFSFLFLELAKKGFIELPSTSGDISYRKFALICMEHFDIKTTSGNLIKEMQEESNLTPANKAMFTIPNIKDIT